MIKTLICEYGRYRISTFNSVPLHLIKSALDLNYKVYCIKEIHDYGTVMYYDGSGVQITEEEYDKLFKLWQINNILGVDING